MKILLLIPYFGQFPKDYFGLFLKSVSYNKQLDFLILCDNLPQVALPANVRVEKMQMSEFNDLATQRLGAQVQVKFGYKLCDFRPMFGQIFADWAKNYDFWGHCDMDLILGNISAFLNEDILTRFDIISLRKEWVSGSFALYKNREEVNNLYKKSADWEKVAKSVDYQRFDECGLLKSAEKMAYRTLAKGENILNLELETESITYIVERIKQSAESSHFAFFQQTLIKESIQKGSILKYEKGQVFIHKSSETRHPENMQFAHYHFITEKNNGFFQFPNWGEIPDIFYIDETGFYTEAEFKNHQTIYNQRIRAGKLKYWFRTVPKKIWSKISKLFKK